MLFYINYNNGEVIPWQGESWEYNDDYTELTVRLRKNVHWSDGEPFTAEDVVFTVNMLKANSPTMGLSSAMVEWVEDIQAPDDFTVVFKFTKPGPRWATDFLATGQTTRFVPVPEHIWKDVQDPTTFEFYDLEKGWPVGTGPYRVVTAGDQQVIFDRRSSWWAVDAGLVPEMPAPERIVLVGATLEARANLYINGDLDVGGPLKVGEFEAAIAQNPKLRSWAKSGPVWGAADGCVYRLTFNCQRPPFDDPDLRKAINYAIDRQQIVDLGYEGSTFVVVAPFASYGGLGAYVAQMQDIFNQHNLDEPNLDKVAEILTGKGFTKDAEGFWVKPDGERLKINIMAGADSARAPIAAQQLQRAGFDAVVEIGQGSVFVDSATTGEFDIHDWVHCGSLYDPWQTLEHYHSKYAAPPGEAITSVRAYTRYENPELDALLDKMQSMVPSPGDAEYMDLVRKATEIYLRDLPDITLAEELHVVVLNGTYWTGWPGEDDPYIAPYLPWEGFNQIIHRLKPTQ
ncbi:MAG: ABC transporter substrate-binding protein, partial [Anaerolineae bacterium]|nr:ABC transporter substrate-binding protein [Anaerolineae bacterium]